MRYDNRLAAIAQDLNREYYGDGGLLSIGKELMWQGKRVRVTGGQYMGEFGISNFWYWSEVLEDGTLGKQHHGYGLRKDFTELP